MGGADGGSSGGGAMGGANGAADWTTAGGGEGITGGEPAVSSAGSDASSGTGGKGVADGGSSGGGAIDHLEVRYNWPEPEYDLELNDDEDNDGVGNFQDNCPTIANPDQAAAFTDSVGDACRMTPHVECARYRSADEVTLLRIAILNAVPAAMRR